MIRILRIKPPSFFHSAEFYNINEELKNYFLDSYDTQKRFNFKNIANSNVLLSLNSMFGDKCAYCESKNIPLLVDHFRPRNGALGLSKKDFSKNHYWWLAYEWDNLYLSCSSCNQSKGNRFPILGKRAEILSTGQSLSNESILLLDPCSESDPAKHLNFRDDGSVVGFSQVGDISIDVFGLNRSSLVSSRFDELTLLHNRCVLLFSQYKSSTELAKNLNFIISTSEAYYQMKIQHLEKWLNNASLFLTKDYQLGQKVEQSKFTIPNLKKIQTPLLFAIPKVELSFKIPMGFNINSSNNINRAENEFKAHLIDKVEINYFKAIEKLTINFKTSISDKASWKMMLGENGASKTSILQAISLALAGTTAINNLNLTPLKFIHQNDSKKTASVLVYLSGENEPIVLEISKDGFHCYSSLPNIILFAYGATRLLGEEGSSNEMNSVYIKNLFDSSEKISGVTAWLISLEEYAFNDVARALKEILSLNDEGRFIRKNNEVFYHSSNSFQSLNFLSDGYQSLIAVTVNLMMRLLNKWPSLDVAEGIVLIDEIGVHMHPRWKMRIVKNLREAFPRVQFISTTHDPLCLRGLYDNEVDVIEKNKFNNVIVKSNLPSIEGMKIDQILISEHFGLHSTLDPDFESNYIEYYKLLTEKSKKKSHRLIELKAYIDNKSVLGSTRRDQILMSIIDEYVIKESSDLKQDKISLRASTKKKIFKIIDEH